ncbi:ShlB/FhaC/HecB family hemolysin secretion/activation protein [Peristeroidobacter soli]|uniref:ShlB/FhaC/HecB family hemolysin secretion/activation protein n=1 Tax=Peristeroidobacter soli TaxID=2497877 RepID=UPI00101BF601|nr:ShlB/FhaC/HecB family hemolysin secretion/activation protein [Peristeroidobacter soli]
MYRHHRKPIIFASLLLGYGGSPLVVQAQQPPPPPPRPDSGQILQELERVPPLRRQRTPESPVPPISTAKELNASSSEDSTLVAVRGYAMRGNTVFQADELLALIHDRTGTLRLSQLEEVAAVITQYYRRHGYMVARAYLPPQDVSDGLVRIEVLEGRYGEVRIINSSSLSEDRIRAIVARSSCPHADSCTGEFVRDRQLEEGMLRLADMPGVAVRGELQPGQEIGSADLLVTVAPGRRLTGEFNVSDSGGRYVGSERAVVALTLANPIGWGDKLNLQTAYSSGSKYAALGYDLPVNNIGTRAFISGYWMDYELQETFRPLGAEGDTVGGEIGFNHILVRDARGNISFGATYGQKSVKDETAVTDLARERDISTYTARFDAALSDAWFGSSAGNRMSLAYTGGKNDIKDAVSLQFDAATARTQGSFQKLAWWLSRNQQLAPRWNLVVRLNGQVATENLDSSEKLYLGGPYAVRAYPVGEAAGDRGYLGTVELRRLFDGPFDGLTQVSAFYDRGHVRINAEPWNVEENERTLEGAGVGVDWNHRYGWSLSAAIAFRGSEKVQAGPDRSYQVWVSAGYQF